MNKTERCEEFLKNLGHGKTIYECESENDKIDEEIMDGEDE